MGDGIPHMVLITGEASTTPLSRALSAKIPLPPHDVGPYYPTYHDWDRYYSFDGASLALLCFEINRPTSLQAIFDQYFLEVHAVLPSVPVILVGIGSELRHTNPPQKCIPEEEIREACSKMGLDAAIELNIASDQGIKNLLNLVCKLIHVTIPGALLADPQPPPPKGWLSFLFGKKTSETHSMKELFGKSSRSKDFPSYGHTSVIYHNHLFFFGGTGPERELRLSPCRVLDIAQPFPHWVPIEQPSDTGSVVGDPATTTQNSDSNSAQSTLVASPSFSSSCTPGTKFIGVGSFPATCTNGDRIAFLFGGLHAGCYTNRLMSYNMTEQTWSTLFPHTVGEVIMTLLSYLAGALLQEPALNSLVSWTSLQVSTSPIPRYHHNAFVHNRILYIYGGLGPENAKLSDLWALNLYTTNCIQIDTTGVIKPTPQRGHNPLCEIFKYAKLSRNDLTQRQFHSVVPAGESLIISCGMWRKERPEVLGDVHILSMFTPSICLPSDVWAIIFSFLDATDLCRFSHTSRYFYNLCSADHFWARFFPEPMRIGGNLKNKYLAYACLWINPSPGELKYTPRPFHRPIPIQYECFLGDAKILRADLSTCRVDEIKVGDSVMSELYSPRIIKEVHTKKIEKPFKMVFLNGVGLTTGHPVFINSKWQRSSDIAEPISVPQASFTIFNFVLDGGPQVQDHSVILNGVVVCTLGKDCGEQMRKEYPLADQRYGTGFWERT
ncbi:hypothetical protein Pelo_9202 [Pelomyxa schiedti]|nr:hypothetical protein Pelo_9202 [Pelomyxa schiedti]